MAKFLQIILVASLAIALCNAAAPRGRLLRFRSRAISFARQEIAPEKEPQEVTPYPSAKELKPDIAFDAEEKPVDELAREPETNPGNEQEVEPEAQPEYEPEIDLEAEPEAETDAESEPEFGSDNAADPRTPDETYGPPEFELAADKRSPDETYGPPEFDAIPASNDEVSTVDDQQNNDVEVESARFILLSSGRRNVKTIRPAKLRTAPKRPQSARLQKMQQSQSQPLFLYRVSHF